MNTTETSNTTSNDAIAFADNGTNATIVIQGAAYENLRKIAAAMNGVGWLDNDNTPVSVLDFFIAGDWLRRLETPTLKIEGITCGGVGEVCCDIAQCIDTGHPDGSPEDEARKSERLAAFKRAGL